MIRLTSIAGHPVVSAAGQPVGVVSDVTVTFTSPHPVVRRVLLDEHARHGGRPRPGSRLVDWSSFESWEPAIVRLSVDGPGTTAEAPELADDELLLWRDVLDSQVVDVRGHRIERVGDLLLTEIDSDGPGPGFVLELAAAEVGAAAVARRLHLASLAHRLDERAIDWADIHLAAGRGHELQLSTTSAAMHTLDGAELAELVARLSTPSATDVLVAVPHERAAAALAASHPSVRHRLAVHLPKPHADAILEHLPTSTAQRLHAARRAHRERGRSRLRWHRHRGWRRTLPPGGGSPTGEAPG